MLWEPIIVEAHDGSAEQVDNKFLIVKDDDLVYISGSYLPGIFPDRPGREAGGED